MVCEICGYWFHPLFMDSEISDYCYGFAMLLLVKSACILIDFCDTFAITLRPVCAVFFDTPFVYFLYTKNTIKTAQK